METLPIVSASSRSLIWREVSLLPSWPASGEVFCADRDRERRLVDRDHRQRARVLGVGERLADRDVGQAGDGDDLARAGLRGLDPVQRLGDVELGDLRARHRAVGAAPGDRRALADRPVAHPADGEAAEVGRGVEVGHVRLQRVALLVGGRRDVLDEQVHQRLEVGALLALRQRRPAGPGVGVDDRELDLVLARVEVDEQLVDLVDDLGDARVRPVDLVDDEDHRQPRLERLAQHEARLGQRALGGVDEQQHAVDHRQPALDLAAEVRVAGRVDDVELHVAVLDRRVLGEDRDALLALEVHRVHDALVDVLVGAERPALPQHRVDQRRLPVVDVGDDGDVAEVLAAGVHGRWRVEGIPAIDSDEIRATLEARRDETRTRVAELAKKPELGEAQGFGKRIGDGTTEAISRLTDIGVGRSLEAGLAADRAGAREARRRDLRPRATMCGSADPAAPAGGDARQRALRGLRRRSDEGVALGVSDLFIQAHPV